MDLVLLSGLASELITNDMVRKAYLGEADPHYPTGSAMDRGGRP